MGTSRKVLAVTDYAGFYGCTKCEYRWTLYADGRVTAEFRSRTGMRYTTPQGWVDIDSIDPDDKANDAEAILTRIAQISYPADSIHFRMTRRGTSRKVLAVVNDVDFYDCTKYGYQWTLYADGRVTAEWRSRWQGSRTGTRYTTPQGWINVDSIDPDNDAEAILTAIAQVTHPEDDRGFRVTRRGAVV